MRPQGYEPRELARLLHSAYIDYNTYLNVSQHQISLKFIKKLQLINVDLNRAYNNSQIVDRLT
jgi:capsule polysaccharide export protein KpsC/LpsZ